jgi:hypothetical protein
VYCDVLNCAMIDMAEILLKVALNTKNQNQIKIQQ